MALDSTPRIDPLTEPEPYPVEAVRRKKSHGDHRTLTDEEVGHLKGLDPEETHGEDDFRVPPPPHFV